MQRLVVGEQMREQLGLVATCGRSLLQIWNIEVSYGSCGICSGMTVKRKRAVVRDVRSSGNPCTLQPHSYSDLYSRGWCGMTNCSVKFSAWKLFQAFSKQQLFLLFRASVTRSAAFRALS